jgi:hypothetical protein
MIKSAANTMSDEFVEIPDRHIRPGGTVIVPRDKFNGQLRLGDRMRFERTVDGRTEILEGMIVDLDTEKVEIDLPYHQPRIRRLRARRPRTL